MANITDLINHINETVRVNPLFAPTRQKAGVSVSGDIEDKELQEYDFIKTGTQKTKGSYDIDTGSGTPLDYILQQIQKPPIVAQIDTIQDAWGLIAGSPEDKVNVVQEITGTTVDDLTREQAEQQQEETLSDVILSDPQGTGWIEKPIITIPFAPVIETPQMPDIFGGLKDVGKWVLIGGGLLAGIWLLGKYIGRGK